MNTGSDQQHEGPSEQLRQFGIDCAAMILADPQLWADAVVWLRDLLPCQAITRIPSDSDAFPDGPPLMIVGIDDRPPEPTTPLWQQYHVYDNQAEMERIQGPTVRRLSNGWNAATDRFRRRPCRDTRYFDLGIDDARRITLLTALTFNRDFDGAALGLGWDWDRPPQCEATFEGWSWARAIITSGLFAEEMMIEVVTEVMDYLRRMAPGAEQDDPGRHGDRSSSGHSAQDGEPDAEDLKGGDEAPPALTSNEVLVLSTMAKFDPSRLLAATRIGDEMESSERLSQETIRKTVKKLIELELAERPEGPRSGARLTIKGRKLAPKIAD